MFSKTFPTDVDPSASDERLVRIRYALGQKDLLPDRIKDEIKRSEALIAEANKSGDAGAIEAAKNKDRFRTSKGDSGNLTVTISEMFEDDLKELKAKLAARNVRLGTLIDVGNAGGIVYNLLDEKGAVIPSAVLRIDTNRMTPETDKENPALISKLLTESNDTFMATVVVRAQPLGREPTKDELYKALAVMNADNLVDRLKNLAPKQFMKVPGIDTIVLTDISCLTDASGAGKATGTVKEFAELAQMDLQRLRTDKVGTAEMDTLRQQQARVRSKAMEELRKAGVQLDKTPTISEETRLEPLNEEKKRGKA